jgi:hypothetical protein
LRTITPLAYNIDDLLAITSPALAAGGFPWCRARGPHADRGCYITTSCSAP